MFSLSIIIAPIIFALISAGGIESNTSSNLPCETDRDCPDTEYCYENKICSPCFSCEDAHRYKSKIRCPRRAKDCGPCLPGYAKESFSVPNKRTVCIPVVTLAQPQLAAENPDNSFLNPIWTIGIPVIGVLILMAFASWHCYKKRSTTVMSEPWQELGLNPRSRGGDGASLPPPSYEDCQRSDNGSVAYSFQLRVTERPESKTTAIPFQMPYGDHILQLTPPENSNPAINENHSNVQIEEIETDYQNPSFNIHDESTQPSMWTPGTSYSMAQNADETDGAVKKEEKEKISPANKRRKTDDKKQNDA